MRTRRSCAHLWSLPLAHCDLGQSVISYPTSSSTRWILEEPPWGPEAGGAAEGTARACVGTIPDSQSCRGRETGQSRTAA